MSRDDTVRTLAVKALHLARLQRGDSTNGFRLLSTAAASLARRTAGALNVGAVVHAEEYAAAYALLSSRASRVVDRRNRDDAKAES